MNLSDELKSQHKPFVQISSKNASMTIEIKSLSDVYFVAMFLFNAFSKNVDFAEAVESEDD